MSEASEKACSLFREGYNCAQAVTAAFAESFGMSQETALRFSEGMGAGMGRLRLTCGAVSAMALLAGLKLSNGKPNDLETRKKNLCGCTRDDKGISGKKRKYYLPRITRSSQAERQQHTARTPYSSIL